MSDEMVTDVSQAATSDVQGSQGGTDALTPPAAEPQTGGTTTDPATAEKMLTQSQVNKIAAAEKRRAEQRAEELLRQERERHAQEIAALRGGAQGSDAPLTRDELRREIAQQYEEEQRLREGHRIASEFEHKVRAAMISDPEFGELYEQLNIESFPALVLMANQLDNTADVVKELAKNPSKFANIYSLAAANPRLARVEFAKISQSIKANQEALKQAQAKPPLDPVKPSTTATSDGSIRLSVSDLRHKFV